MTIQDVITLYGPLGLGWVIAAMLWRRNVFLTDRWVDQVEKITEAKITMSHTLHAALEALKP